MNKLARFRSILQRENLYGYIVPTSDSHNSEYVSAADERRKWISGFSGSAGTALVTQDDALLWTDGRYFLQAEKQLSSEWRLMKMGIDKNMSRWIREDLSRLASSRRLSIGTDPALISVSAANELMDDCRESGIDLVYTNENLVDLAWNEDASFPRPSPPSTPLYQHPPEFAGMSFAEKKTRVLTFLQEKACQGMIVTALDELAWLFNFRASDVAYTPVCLSFAVLTAERTLLYIRDGEPSLRQFFDESVELRPYAAFYADLPLLTQSISSLLIHEDSCNRKIRELVRSRLVVNADSPVNLLKCVKNETELQGFRNCHVRDGAALALFFYWLAHRPPTASSLDEVDISERLLEFRRSMSLFVSESFATIAGSGPNGAIIHYKPDRPTAALVDPFHTMLLLDSGAQYLDGTTDVTRTVHFGTPTTHERRCYTLVLKGHIALARAVFPAPVASSPGSLAGVTGGTNGYSLDILARQFLWQAGLDYRHGTGHGVDAHGPVHSGPHGISARPHLLRYPFKAGYVVTNEPGYYEPGQFGIRIENIMLTTPVASSDSPMGQRFLQFEQATVYPYCRSLIDEALLTPEEKAFINRYHALCYERVDPFLRQLQLQQQHKHKHTQSLSPDSPLLLDDPSLLLSWFQAQCFQL